MTFIICNQFFPICKDISRFKLPIFELFVFFAYAESKVRIRFPIRIIAIRRSVSELLLSLSRRDHSRMHFSSLSQPVTSVSFTKDILIGQINFKQTRQVYMPVFSIFFCLAAPLVGKKGLKAPLDAKLGLKIKTITDCWTHDTCHWFPTVMRQGFCWLLQFNNL